MENPSNPQGRPRLVVLDAEHPGFRDPAYRARRDAIARIALTHTPGEGRSVPQAPYSPEEQALWRAIWRRLGPLHAERVCAELDAARRALDLSAVTIPQLGELSRRIEPRTGFRMEPVAGLVEVRPFLEALGRGVFLSTQYIRHASRPFYTPEPDVVHEIVGHAASLTHPQVARVNRAFGAAAARADEAVLEELNRLYWYSMEFGLALEGGEPRAFGAGLLSSVGELEQFDSGPQLLDWDLERMAATPYDPTDLQPRLFVAPSFGRALADLAAWLEEPG